MSDPNTESTHLPPSLPVESGTNIMDRNFESGYSMSTVISESGKYAIKVLRPRVLSTDKTSFEPNPQVNVSEDKVTTRALLDNAKKRQDEYNSLLPDLEEFLPKVYGQAVIDSPSNHELYRKTVIQSVNDDIREDLLQTLPLNEPTLMEICEAVDEKSILSNLSHREIFNYITSDPLYKMQAKKFANSALEAIHRGHMIDLADYRGIRIKFVHDQSVGMEHDMHSVIKIANNDTEYTAFAAPIPHGVAFDSTVNRIKFIDTSPVIEIGPVEDQKFIARVKKAIVENDAATLESLAEDENPNEEQFKKAVIYNLALLKSMGADFDV